VVRNNILGPGDYEAFQKYLQDVCGIVLGSGKEYLVTSRLSSLLQSNNIKSIGQLLQELKKISNKNLQVSIIDAMTTNETFWFRDMPHYNLLIDMIFPEAESRIRKSMRIWSAACSSGQEPYNISMTAQQYLSANPGRLSGGVEIIGTDISTRMLEEAKKGIYCGIAASRGLSAEQSQRFFIPRDDCMEVRPEIRKRVSFRHHNMTESYALMGRFDVIFCRNVLIYFSAEKKADIIKRMAATLNPNGYLFLGSTESLTAHSDLFEMVSKDGGIVYRLK
jgi:chemotaxis protein methyltransferase CheR